MTTLREALQELAGELRGSVLVEDNAGAAHFPSDLLQDMESDEEGQLDLSRAVVRVARGEHDLDSVIAYVSLDGYEYPNESRWYVRWPSRLL